MREKRIPDDQEADDILRTRHRTGSAVPKPVFMQFAPHIVRKIIHPMFAVKCLLQEYVMTMSLT